MSDGSDIRQSLREGDDNKDRAVSDEAQKAAGRIADKIGFIEQAYYDDPLERVTEEFVRRTLIQLFAVIINEEIDPISALEALASSADQTAIDPEDED